MGNNRLLSDPLTDRNDLILRLFRPASNKYLFTTVFDAGLISYQATSLRGRQSIAKTSEAIQFRKNHFSNFKVLNEVLLNKIGLQLVNH
jgi:hypothetical protein